MGYIECAHCGKQYEVTDKIRESEGQFVTCTACQREFLIVIADDEAEDHHQKEMEKATNTTGWDPSLTMPVDGDTEVVSDKVKEKALKDDAAEAEALLVALQADKKKKIHLAILLGVLVIVMGLYLFFQGGEEPVQQAKVSVETEKKVMLSPKAQDETNPVCRQAAAKQWMIDSQAMHGDYNAEEFVRILMQSNKQKAIVQSQCVQKDLIKEIIAAATAKEVPSWLELEISALQANRK